MSQVGLLRVGLYVTLAVLLVAVGLFLQTRDPMLLIFGAQVLLAGWAVLGAVWLARKRGRSPQ